MELNNYIEKWNLKFFNPIQKSDEEIENAVKKLYSFAKLENPEIIISDSPSAMFKHMHNLEMYEKTKRKNPNELIVREKIKRHSKSNYFFNNYDLADDLKALNFYNDIDYSNLEYRLEADDVRNYPIKPEKGDGISWRNFNRIFWLCRTTIEPFGVIQYNHLCKLDYLFNSKKIGTTVRRQLLNEIIEINDSFFCAVFFKKVAIVSRFPKKVIKNENDYICVFKDDFELEHYNSYCNYAKKYNANVIDGMYMVYNE